MPLRAPLPARRTSKNSASARGDGDSSKSLVATAPPRSTSSDSALTMCACVAPCRNAMTIDNFDIAISRVRSARGAPLLRSLGPGLSVMALLDARQAGQIDRQRRVLLRQGLVLDQQRDVVDMGEIQISICRGATHARNYEVP